MLASRCYFLRFRGRVPNSLNPKPYPPPPHTHTHTATHASTHINAHMIYLYTIDQHVPVCAPFAEWPSSSHMHLQHFSLTTTAPH